MHPWHLTHMRHLWCAKTIDDPAPKDVTKTPAIKPVTTLLFMLYLRQLTIKNLISI
jgi:hypothetical protein